MGMIHILKFTPHVKGPLLGFLDIKVHPWKNFIIRSISLFKKENGERWISFPSQMYEKDGERKYKPYNLFESPQDSASFQKEVLKAFDEYSGQPGQSKIEPIPMSYPKPDSQMELPF